MLSKSTSINSPLDPRYRRVQFLKALLWIIIVVAPLLAVVNYIREQHSLMVALELGLLAIAAGLFLWLEKQPKAVLVISWLVTLLISSVVAVYIVVSQGQSYSLYWLAVIPPVAYALLGGRWGLLLSAAFLLGVFSFISVTEATWSDAPFTIDSLLNIIIATTALIILLRYIEQTRSDAFHFLHQHSERLKSIAVTDPLTGLFNRVQLDHDLNHSLVKARQSDSGFSIMLIDIDHFKRVNDTYGHQVGDIVLVELAQILRTRIRSTDVAGRWGGEEFLVLVPNSTSQQCVKHAEIMREAIAHFSFHDGIRITASFGVASFRNGDDSESLIERVDKALYQAKAEGRNRTVSA